MSQRLSDVFVSVVAPLDNNATIAQNFIEQAASELREHYANYELILIDNGSTDGSTETIQSLLGKISCIRFIRLSRREDRETAIFAGLESSIGDYVVVLMPPSDPPGLITQFVEATRNHKDIVYGVSTTPLRDSFLSRIGSRVFYWYSRRYLGLNVPNNATYALALNRRAVNAIVRMKGRYRHVRHLSRLVGFNGGMLAYEPQYLSDKHRDRKFFESISLAFEISVSYSRHPLRFITWLGVLAGTVDVLYAAYSVIVFFVKKHVAEGWTTLSLQVSLMFFLIFIILTIMSEYLGRIMEETRNQPPYHIMEELTSTVLVADETRRNITQ